MSAVESEIATRWPLHWQVWHDDPQTLKRLLLEKLHDREERDPRGRTPLHLAVALRRTNCVGVLLSFGANALAVNRHQWSVLHEAVSTGDPELIGMVLCCRDRQQLIQRDRLIPELLERLVTGPDFYIEMKWEFTSWIPFMTRLCPSDTYRIWKKGAAVRVDTTLIGFQNLQWLRGKQSMLFKATAEGATMVQIDHDKQTVWQEQFTVAQDHDRPVRMEDQAMGVARRLSSPIVSTVIDTDSIAFQRQKSGIWGFRSDRTENIGGYDAKVFSATGLNMITRTRVEHLSEVERQRCKGGGFNPLQGFLGVEDDQVGQMETPSPAAQGILNAGTVTETVSSSSRLSVAEYFSAPANTKDYDGIGCEVDIHSRVQQLKATVWLSEGYPMSLHDQILPIIELMSISDTHFAKVKEFIALQMPAGFPVKFEIPLFHVMSARVTFGNVNGHLEPAAHVSLHTEEVVEEEETSAPLSPNSSLAGEGPVKRRHSHNPEESHSHLLEDTPTTESSERPTESQVKRREVCTIGEEAFLVPEGYRQLNQWRGSLADQEEEMLQLAIRQSLMDQGAGVGAGGQEEVTLMEALSNPSLSVTTERDQPSMHQAADDSEANLEIAIALSQAMAQEDDQRRAQEEEELQRVLRLSLEEQ